MSKVVKKISLFLLLILVAVCLGMVASGISASNVYSISGSWESSENYDNEWYEAVIDDSTPGSSYTIATAAQFAAFAKTVNDGKNYAGDYLQLTDNIDLKEHYWVPVGVPVRINSKSFKGTFDGNDKTISNVSINPEDDFNYAYGIFGVVDGGTIKNLNVSNINIEIINKSSQKGLGGIAGEIISDGVIENCSVFSSRLSAKNNAGGIVGIANDSNISNCKVYSCYINAQVNAGGIIGTTKGASDNPVEIKNCLSANNIILAESYTIIAGVDSTAAGIIGNSLNTSVKSSQSEDNVIISQVYAAGLVGVAYNTKIEGCYNTSSVSGKDGASFAGISSQKGADGISGFGQTNGANGKDGADGENGLNGGNAGGLVCLFDYQSTIKDCFNAGSISGGHGGNGGNGGAGGNGGNGGKTNNIYTSNGGNGGNGGSGGNGGNGGSAGAIYVFFIDNVANPVINMNSNIINTFTNSKIAINADSGGSGGKGGNSGEKGSGIASGKDGNSGATGKTGGSGSVVALANEKKDPLPNLIFIDDDPETPETKGVGYNELFGKLPMPSKERYDFAGWNTESDGTGKFVTEKTRFLSVDDISLYAQFNELKSVTINPNNGESSYIVSGYEYTRVIDKLTVPVKAGYAFNGWYKANNSKLINETFSDLEGMTVHAEWLQEIKINFNVAGGLLVGKEEPNELNNYNVFDSITNQTYVIRVSGRPIGALPVAESYNNSEYFGGWYTNLSDSSTYVPATNVYSGDITLYARWNSNAYMEYNLMGATGINDCSTPWNGTAASSYAGGNGTVSSPYQIATAEQLKKLANDINGSNSNNYKGNYFILTSNIDLANRLWTPIGNASDKRFEGDFHGNGFYIKGLNVSTVLTSGTANTRNYMGLFGAAYNAKIRQVGLESGIVEFKASGTSTFSSSVSFIYAGAIIGRCAGATVVDQCYSNINIDINVNRATALNVIAYVGGLIGKLDNGTETEGDSWTSSSSGSIFKDSYNTGNINSYFKYTSGRVYNFVGGIIGYVYKSDFANVYNTGNINITTEKTSGTDSTIAFAGGICGEINSKGSLTNSFNIGTVSARCYSSQGGDKRGEVGGVVAHLNNSTGETVANDAITINGCKNFGNLSLDTDSNSSMPGGGRDIGGIIGLIVGDSSRIVSGSKNYWKYNASYYGICSYSNGSIKCTSGNNATSGTQNGNNLVIGQINLKALSSTSAYGEGDFAFTKTSYFQDTNYFSNTNGSITWDFISADNAGIWEFRLDRNDNLPMLRYMCYETKFENGAISPNRKYVYEDVPIGRLIVPVRTGYTFMGWWNVPVEFDPALGTIGYNGVVAIDGQNGFIKYEGKEPQSLIDQDFSSKIKFVGRNNIQIYAAWMPVNPPSTEIALNNISGPGSGTKVVKAFKDYQFGQLYTPEKEGYVFLGWFDAINGGNQYTSDIVYNGGNIPANLYARWQAIDYTISFDMNDADIEGNEIIGSAFIIAMQYDVTYNQSVGMIPTPYIFGYTFMGWNTKKNGTGSAIIINSIYEIPNNITLYAQWEKNDYAITFDKNGQSVINTVTGSMDAQSFAFGENKNLSGNGFSVEGYTFAGWALSPTGTVMYPNASSYTMATEGNKTLYAIWQANVYYIRIDTDGGYVSNVNNLIRAGTANTNVPLPTPVKAGWDFDGWQVFDESGAPLIISGTQLVLPSGTATIKIGAYGIPQNLDLKAIWKAPPTPYTIIFDINDGTGSASIFEGTLIGNDSKEIVCDISRTGYTFMGWSLIKNGSVHITSNIEYLNLDLAMVAAAIDFKITLYAVWNPWEYTIAFDSNKPLDTEISGTMQKQTYIHNEEKKLKENVFIAPGYTFLGWSTTPGGLVVYTNSQSISISSSIDLYAKWEAIVYTIEYRNGNSFATDTNKISFGSKNVQLKTNETIKFKKDFYTFDGWSLKSGQLYGNGFSNLTIDYNLLTNPDAEIKGTTIVLYAAWTPNEYTLKYYYDDKDTVGTTLKLTFAEETNFDAPFKAGYDFIGFNLKETAPVIFISLEGGQIYLSNDYFPGKVDGIPYELIAVFKPFELTITGQSINSVEYGDNANVKITTNWQDENVPLTFDITVNSGNELIRDFSFDKNNGVITFKAKGIGIVQFRVTVKYDGWETAVSDSIEIVISKRTLTVVFDEFVYNGLTQSATYSLQRIVGNDNVACSIDIVGDFKNAGVYKAFISLTTMDDFYDLETSEFLLEMKKADLVIIGNNASRDYFKDNPAFTSKILALAEFEQDILNITGIINSRIIYNVLCKKQSSSGTYTIYQSMSDSDILRLSNYNIKFQDGTLTINPIVLENPSIKLKTGESGYVEGGLLYFDIDDINFGVDGVFDWDDFNIKWYYSNSIDGTWHEIQNENTNRLILTNYKLKLGVDIEGLFFKAEITGKDGGNIAVGEVASVVANQKIAAAPKAPALSNELITTISTLSAFALAILIVMIVIGVLNGKRIKVMKRHIVDEEEDK